MRFEITKILFVTKTRSDLKLGKMFEIGKNFRFEITQKSQVQEFREF